MTQGRPHIDGEWLGDGVLGFVQILEHLLQGLVLLNQLVGTFRSNAPDCPAVIAAAEDANVDELLLHTRHILDSARGHTNSGVLKGIVLIDGFRYQCFQLLLGHEQRAKCGQAACSM
jgi:hypothetical protein